MGTRVDRIVLEDDIEPGTTPGVAKLPAAALGIGDYP